MLPIILPLVSFVLPIIVIVRSGKRPVKRPFVYSLCSFAAAMGAICQELWMIWQRSLAGDSSGIFDTAGAALALSVGIALAALLLNLIALGLSYGDKN